MLYAIYNVLRHIAIDPKTYFKWDWDPRDVIRERNYYVARVAVSYKDVAPTILKLLGMNKEHYMKGKSLSIFKNRINLGS